MPNKLSDTAMILAAGRGVRMQPLTLTKPKPLLEIGGRTMLDLALDKLVTFGIRHAVVNTFYLAEQIENHLKARKDIEIVISRETELLDTGGGIKNALAHFGGKPFFALNADLPWMESPPHLSQKEIDPPSAKTKGLQKEQAQVFASSPQGGKPSVFKPALSRMAEAWDPQRMDALLLLMPAKKARGFGPKGDFAMEADGRVHRKDIAPPWPFVWISAQILKPQPFSEVAENTFSNNRIWDEAEAQNKLWGLEHTGSCYHAGTPGDLERANQLLASGQGWRSTPLRILRR